VPNKSANQRAPRPTQVSGGSGKRESLFSELLAHRLDRLRHGVSTNAPSLRTQPRSVYIGRGPLNPSQTGESPGFSPGLTWAVARLFPRSSGPVNQRWQPSPRSLKRAVCAHQQVVTASRLCRSRGCSRPDRDPCYSCYTCYSFCHRPPEPCDICGSCDSWASR